MTEADKPAFVAALNELALLRPTGLRLTEAHYAAWWNAMRHDWELGEFQRACAVLAQDVEDFAIGPQHFARLRRAATEPGVGDAWAKVRARLTHVGPRDQVSIDPRIDRVVAAMGGYYRLASTSSDAMAFRENRFRELWAEFGEADTAMAALPDARPVTRLRGPVAGGEVARALLSGKLQ